MNLRSKIISASLATLLCWSPMGFVRGDEPAPAARVTAGIGSAQTVLDSLEYMVVDLAGKKKTYEDTVFPNLDIFLIGVSTDQPIRFDLLFSPVKGLQTQAIIPTSNLREFRVDNLEPIGIDTTADKSDKNLFECTGTVYEGWMRYLPKPVPYSVFYAQKQFIPENMPHPEAIHKPLAEKGLMAFLYMANSAEGAENRKAAFEAYRKTSDESFKKLSDESRDQFALRQATRDEFLAILEQWIVEIARAEFGAQLDQEKGRFPGYFTLAALPDTSLARDLNTLKTTASQFDAVVAPENNILTARINLPKNAERIPQMKKIYELARPVLKERIDQDEKATAEEKAARNEIVSILLDVLTENLDSQATVDGLVDVIPVKDKHMILMAVAASGQEKFNQIIEKIPAAKAGWNVATNTDKVGDVAIHKLTFGSNPPKSLTDFYGNSNEAWIAVGPKNIWLAGGEGALDTLKAQLEKVNAAASSPAEPTGVLLTAGMNTRAVLSSLDAIKNDPELAILQQINVKGRRQARIKEGQPEKKEEDAKPGSKAAGELANFVWVPTALEVLQGQPDRVTVSIKLDETNQLVGASDVEVGLLKALGALIAKFADENLK